MDDLSICGYILAALLQLVTMFPKTYSLGIPNQEPFECPTVRSVKVRQEMLEGRWFVVMKSLDPLAFDFSTSCRATKYDFDFNDYGWYINVNTTVCYNIFHVWNQCTNYSTKAYQLHRDNRTPLNQGSFTADFSQKGPENQKPNYHFVSLDEEFAVVYFCTKFTEHPFEMAFVMSRSRDPHPKLVQMAERKLAYSGLDLEMIEVKNTKCPQELLIDYEDYYGDYEYNDVDNNYQYYENNFREKQEFRL
ncbi:uncharacterized protein LOC142354303 isoform X2 [Convolutriloba macropyga]|uniref:uncharacterized protein LOC142354303 isoform X2 n=1 Tax=Convolutriloba macropyga TaxID=536237 RepID=UPI003F51F6BE